MYCVFCLALLLLIGCQTSYKFSRAQKSLIMEDDAQAPMRVFKITNYADSVLLRTPSEPVLVDADDPILNTLIDRLFATVRDSMSLGVGIAAPQVGILKDVIWVQRFDKENLPFELYLNPEIMEYSVEKLPCREGCLSIPERIDTTYSRSETIRISYSNLNNEHITETVSGFTAVIFQHEIDHLNGIIYLDHLEDEIKQTGE